MPKKQFLRGWEKSGVLTGPDRESWEKKSGVQGCVRKVLKRGRKEKRTRSKQLSGDEKGRGSTVLVWL